MNISIIDAFNQTVKKWDVDLNSDYPKSESQFCISKMFDLFDLSGKNVYETKLFIESVAFFNLIFPDGGENF
jgi:hypothetical protein